MFAVVVFSSLFCMVFFFLDTLRNPLQVHNSFTTCKCCGSNLLRLNIFFQGKNDLNLCMTVLFLFRF